MSGKVYTMKEMKAIVTYLTEHQAYGEVRGRKMWVDYANSNATTRTWQSLKETFLKRILPDIHNPYYNLTREQIISFRQGYDVEQRDKNKLEIQPVGDNSNNNTENNKDNEEQVVTSSDEAMVQGENDKCSNVTPKDIPVQETCYKTIDDLRRDLESPKTEDDNKSTHSKSEENMSTVKTNLKDFTSNSDNMQEENPKITTSENQNGIELGASEDTDKTRPDSVSAVQDKNSDDTNVKTDENNVTEKKLQMEDDGNNIGKNLSDGNVTVESDEVKVVEKDVSDDILEISSTNNKDKETTFNKKNETQESITTNLTSSVQPLTNSNSESVLPNNQEGLKIQNNNTSEVDNTSDAKNNKKKPLRKRSSSAETVLIESKRQKRDSTYDASDKNSVTAENESEPEVYNVIDSDSEHTTEIKENKAETSNNTLSRQSVDEATPTQNPCLESVSLFAEQFNERKYIDTTSDENTSKKNDPKPSGSKEVKKDDDVVVLKSHSESESGEESTEMGHRSSKRASHAKRKKALANVFGVYSGAVSSRQNRQSSQVRRSHKVPHPNDDQVSDSSEWTTDTEHDAYISPPRGRKHRMARKYLKPKSARVLSLEEEGGLFVMYRKRIYPLVKDGRIVKNYVIYESNSDSGFEQDTYWKAKYAELKKKYEEKKKAKEPSERSSSASHEPSSPILQPNIRKNPPPVQNYDIHAPSTSASYPAIQNTEPVIQQPVQNKTLDKITIKYIMSNAEVQLEGHWPQICPVFDKVLDRFPKKLEPAPSVEAKRASVEVSEHPNVILSGESTPIIGTNDPAIQEKIDKLESEIFKKIEEKDKEDEINNDTEENTTTNNVTSRKRGRPTKQSMSPETPKKQPKPSPPKKKIPAQAKNTPESVEVQSDGKQKTEVPPVRTRRSMKAALDAQKESKTDATQRTSNTPQTTTNRIQRPRSFADQIVFQDDNSFLASESTQGYHESDVSPVKLKRRRKSKRSTIAHRNKLQSKRNQRLQPYLLQDASSDSTSTSFSGSFKSKTSQSSSEIHKSDSYRHLFPRAKISFNRLEPISEKSATVNEVEMRPFDVVSRNELNTDSMDSDILINGSTGVGSSSNVSLPQSPELSIVEDISIGKELLNSIKNYHNMKNAPTIEVIMGDEQDKYMISDVDVTLPLMEQKCVLQKSNPDVEMKSTNKTKRTKKPSVSESLINKIGTVNIRDNSAASDSLDLQLRNLLLESAKKMSKANRSKENMEIDENILHTMQNSKAKRRCSTPRKKKETKKSKLSSQITTVEDLETCSYRARKSCPPSIQIQEENPINSNEINIEIVENVKNKPKSRKKKDIIKVKILRPRHKSVSTEDKGDRTQRASKMSICTDSGINGTESSAFPISNDTVELIHNHSETCLHANECLNNSVEFVNASTTIISVNSNSITTEWQDSRHFKDCDDMSLCSMNNNVQSACNNVECTKTHINDDKVEKKSKRTAHNEILNSSLITEDLSDEASAQPVVPSHPSRWYLLSEDETTNTNFVSPTSNTGGFGSNLNQIFPLACAVPNLSTITEMSKDSRKPFGLDSFTTDSNSQNIFL